MTTDTAKWRNHPALKVAATDPTDPRSGGRLLAVADLDKENAPRTARVAKRIADATDGIKPPEQPPSPPMVSKLPAPPTGATRDLTPSEVALLTLLGQRRDELTDEEADTARRLAFVAKADSADWNLVEYIIEPARQRAKAEHAQARADALRAHLAQIPARPPKLASADVDELLGDLTNAIRDEAPGLTVAQARQIGFDAISDAMGEAAAAFTDRRQQIEEQIAELQPTSGPTPAAPVAPVAPIPASEPRTFTMPNGRVINEEQFNALAAVVDLPDDASDAERRAVNARADRLLTSTGSEGPNPAA